MKTIFLSERRLQLSQRLSELETSMTKMQAELTEASESQTNSLRDSFDHTIEQNEMSTHFEMYERYTHERRQILSALDRIEKGSFGECTGCGDIIAAKRLLVQPSADLCVECQHQKEADSGLDMATVQEINPSSLIFLFDSAEVA
ncbi:MAG: TraR/DksA family transcriptional regulator [Bacteriovorax sp.]|nr:TraR/DksA family transcriptional regulator [Bacteriovorax sp.]